MQRTAISNPYFMEAPPRERTPIELIDGEEIVHCYGCGREILPRIIHSPFIGSRRHTLEVCPMCNTVVQDPPKPSRSRKGKTVFVWQCTECSARYPENDKLPLAISPQGVTCRVCASCFAEVRLVEWS